MEGRGAGILVEIRELEEGRTRFQQFLIFAFDRQTRGRPLLAVVQQYEFAHRLQLVGELLDKRQEVRVDQHGGWARIVQHEYELLGRKREIDRLQHRSHHGHREITLMIAVAVPIQHRDNVTLLDADLRETARQAPNALTESPVSVPPQVAVHDFLIRRVGKRIMQQMLDEKRILIC